MARTILDKGTVPFSARPLGYHAPQHMEVSGRTRVVGIIGDPVDHSLSPAMHNAAFRALKLDYTYVPFRVAPARLRQAVAGLRALGVAGVNVTVPHKERAMPLLDSVSRTARRVGAVNTIVHRSGRLHGENTDVIGFVRALHEKRFHLSGVRVLVVGAGGVARAVLAALAAEGVRGVTIANRTLRRARRLADQFRSDAMSTGAATLAELEERELLGAVDLIVNASSVGLHGERFFPLAYAKTPRQCLFFDLIYGCQTDFLRCAARAQRRTLDGRSMLLHQGAAAFTLWTGRPAPLAAMRASLRRSVAHTRTSSQN